MRCLVRLEWNHKVSRADYLWNGGDEMSKVPQSGELVGSCIHLQPDGPANSSIPLPAMIVVRFPEPRRLNHPDGSFSETRLFLICEECHKHSENNMANILWANKLIPFQRGWDLN